MHRKMFLRGYLNKLCSDPSKMKFWEYLDKVGTMHVGQGRTHPLHMEYVHMGVTLSFVQDILTEAILSHPKLKMDRKIGLVKALSNVIWIQNDLFVKWYVRDGDEFTDEVLVPEIEPEGYLHGKKIRHDASESESEIEDTAMAAGSCPFKNLAASPRGNGTLQQSMEIMSMDESPQKDGACSPEAENIRPTPASLNRRTCPVSATL
ncbi:uncharacterized protein M421DRAFT_420647 [Didymella exigua CBS 183.55]|uniref:Globin-sensor domain-containing protein n=1 Tax=Didymella exigua CBS 183.55 TaxID=1150837 RepID=A0A6A5RK19_9PLEO|nr:uncharacterized protein M421DRAFT_420647 [Didymella exigua CBS 183.55]KAF1928751.1 hypothetical protein M421DRAFT_420647 [Didymella exigua CBS 183.55]